jgi:hypothetical protein
VVGTNTGRSEYTMRCTVSGARYTYIRGGKWGDPIAYVITSCSVNM